MPLEAGRRLGLSEVISPLGAGGMGEVYRARDMRLGRDVALKVLPGEFAWRPDRRARFEREARVLASFQHPGIAAIHGFEESDGVSFLVLELVEGKTLAQRLDRVERDADARRAREAARLRAGEGASGRLRTGMAPRVIQVVQGWFDELKRQTAGAQR